ncbi:MAG TPA: hypothetical protein VMP11_19670 [Verrucomicrobiae bacterium]|nr:hypothetical protein [Verrucomicrobiae bacterium]
MRNQLPVIAVVCVVVALFMCPIASAQQLPTFEDFRRVDQMRRTTGQLETADLLKLTRIDRLTIDRLAQQGTNDYQLIWGAAELISDWPTKHALFQSALAASRTNLEIELRYACAAAAHNDFATALPLLHAVEKGDSANIVPWFVEFTILKSQNHGLTGWKMAPSWAIRYHDYSSSAARARIHALEAAGYSPYSARRIGFMPDTPVLVMVRNCVEERIEKTAAPLLSRVANAMQDRPTYLVTELVGQSLERALIQASEDEQTDSTHSGTGADESFRLVQLERRRDEIKSLLSSVSANIVDLATEAEMIEYFNNVLALGEELAMKRLADTVQGGHLSP